LKNKGVIVVLVVVVVITALLFVPQFFSRHKDSAKTNFHAAPEFPAKGSVAPDFTLPVLEGSQDKTLQLSSLKGKAVLINLWATWCEPCKIEMPWLVGLQKKYGDQGFVILGVAQDDSSNKEILDFAHKMKLNYPILKGNSKVDDLYPSQGLPLSVYVDRNGKVVDRVLGLVSESVMEDDIKKALEQK
jgi:thiol-disulfide isomerase/thioredoxin